MIRRPPRSTPLYSSAASDVYKRQGEVPGAVAEYGSGFLGQRSKHHFAHLSVREGPVRGGVYDLRVELLPGDHRPLHGPAPPGRRGGRNGVYYADQGSHSRTPLPHPGPHLPNQGDLLLWEKRSPPRPHTGPHRRYVDRGWRELLPHSGGAGPQLPRGALPPLHDPYHQARTAGRGHSGMRVHAGCLELPQRPLAAGGRRPPAARPTDSARIQDVLRVPGALHAGALGGKNQARAGSALRKDDVIQVPLGNVMNPGLIPPVVHGPLFSHRLYSNLFHRLTQSQHQMDTIALRYLQSLAQGITVYGSNHATSETTGHRSEHHGLRHYAVVPINLSGDIHIAQDHNVAGAVSYTHLRAHETKANLVCRLLL